MTLPRGKRRSSIHRLVTILAAKANLPHDQVNEALRSVSMEEIPESSYKSEVNSYAPRIFNSQHDYTLVEHINKIRPWGKLK